MRNLFQRALGEAKLGLPGFDPAYYLTSYPDVEASGQDPLQHYLEHGWKENRDPSAGFSTSGYLNANPDVLAAGQNPLLHFLNNGLSEGRTGYAKNPQPLSSLQERPVIQDSVSDPRDPNKNGICHGYIDGLTNEFVRGWAFDPGQANLPLKIEIYIDGKSSVVVEANIFRHDLKENKIGTGCHGFMHIFSPSLEKTSDHLIIVRRLPDNVEISRASLQCQN